MIAGMFYTPERAQRFDFAIRHAVASGDVFTRYGDGVRSLEELRGQRVAVQKGHRPRIFAPKTWTLSSYNVRQLSKLSDGCRW